MKAGAEWLADKMATHSAETVGYATETATVSVAAQVAGRPASQDQETGAFLDSQGRDFLIRAADLVFEGEQITPQPGHKIMQGDSVFEVMSIDGRPAWEWSDEFFIVRRIHTKEVASE